MSEHAETEPENTLLFSKDIQHRLEADYQDRVNVFRASVVDTLAKVEALNELGGWAAFYGDTDTENYTFDSYKPDGYKDILIMLSANDGPSGSRAPTIRMLTNELYVTPKGIQWFVQDFIVDYEGDCQYLVSACNPDTDPKFEESTGVFFLASDGRLALSNNFQYFTPGYEVEGHDEEGNVVGGMVEPFGGYHCFEDKVYALNQGETILKAISNPEPYARHAGKLE